MFFQKYRNNFILKYNDYISKLLIGFSKYILLLVVYQKTDNSLIGSIFKVQVLSGALLSFLIPQYTDYIIKRNFGDNKKLLLILGLLISVFIQFNNIDLSIALFLILYLAFEPLSQFLYIKHGVKIEFLDAFIYIILAIAFFYIKIEILIILIIIYYLIKIYMYLATEADVCNNNEFNIKATIASLAKNYPNILFGIILSNNQMGQLKVVLNLFSPLDRFLNLYENITLRQLYRNRFIKFEYSYYLRNFLIMLGFYILLIVINEILSFINLDFLSYFYFLILILVNYIVIIKSFDIYFDININDIVNYKFYGLFFSALIATIIVVIYLMLNFDYYLFYVLIMINFFSSIVYGKYIQKYI